MIDISFELNGRKVSPNSLGNALEAAMLNSIKDSISKSVGNIRCSEHGGRPKIKAKGRKVSLRNSGSVWTISTVKGNQLIKKGKKGYLTPTTDVQTAEWNTNVVMKVTRKKTKWTIGPEDGSSIEDMDDCLQGLRLSTSGTNLNYDCANREFRYDDEESSWSLIAV